MRRRRRCPTTHSAVTQTRSAIDALTLIPVAMLGAAAGSVTRPSLPRRVTPDVRATSWSMRSLPRTPYSVWMRIGHIAAYAITNRCVGMPMPKNRNESGMSATPGIGRRNSSTTEVASISVRELPMTTPRPTPSAIAIANPWT